jgi:ribosomal protein S12
MIRGGRVPDLPGVRYHVCVQKEILITRITYALSTCSKYGVKDMLRLAKD